MADEANETANAGEPNTQEGGDGKSTFEAITSQEDLDRIVQSRLDRERKKFADYDDLKSKAQKLSEMEEANKTAEQKQAERLAEIERENAELKTANLRAEVAAAKGVPANLLTGSTQEELEAAADALIEFRGELKKPKLHLPNEGKQPKVSSGSTAEQFAQFMQDKL